MSDSLAEPGEPPKTDWSQKWKIRWPRLAEPGEPPRSDMMHCEGRKGDRPCFSLPDLQMATENVFQLPTIAIPLAIHPRKSAAFLKPWFLTS